MATLKEVQQPVLDRDDLSDAASSHADQQTLPDEEELPSYSHELPGSSIGAGAAARPEKAPAQPEHALGPTTSAPFNFPIAELPSYESAIDITKPLAIPQITPSPDAPFIPAFSRTLLSYGIPEETWHSFLSTLSAFVSANIGQQAVHHAYDLANNIAEFHKQYALEVSQKAKDIGKKAQHFNPVGVVGGVIGLTLHSVGHVVGSVFNVHNNIWTKPKHPRERATVYIAAANQDWFHSRGLHALLMDTVELANVLGLGHEKMIAIVNGVEADDPALKLSGLRDWIADVEVRPEPVPVPEDGATGAGVGDGATAGSSSGVSGAAAGPSSDAAGKQPAKPELQIGTSTLWLVITQESKIQAITPPADVSGSKKKSKT